MLTAGIDQNDTVGEEANVSIVFDQMPRRIKRIERLFTLTNIRGSTDVNTCKRAQPTPRSSCSSNEDSCFTIENDMGSIDEHVTPIDLSHWIARLNTPCSQADHFPQLRITRAEIEASANTCTLFQGSNIQIRRDNPTEDVDQHFRWQTGYMCRLLRKVPLTDRDRLTLVQLKALQGIHQLGFTFDCFVLVSCTSKRSRTDDHIRAIRLLTVPCSVPWLSPVDRILCEPYEIQYPEPVASLLDSI